VRARGRNWSQKGKASSRSLPSPASVFFCAIASGRLSAPSRRAVPAPPPGKTKAPRGVRKADASVARWQTREDIPMDDEDHCACPPLLCSQCYILNMRTVEASRDQILLEADEQGASDDGDDDEVFALQGLAPSSDASDEDEDASDEEDAAPTPSSKPSKAQKKKKPAPPASSASENEEDEEEEEGWGRKKAAYYASNAELIASDDDEANELEEAEARRLQLKARSALRDEDFGLADLSAPAPGDGDADL
jgi:U3 small nucleolar RNA-associated protein 3